MALEKRSKHNTLVPSFTYNKMLYFQKWVHLYALIFALIDNRPPQKLNQ